jgi:alanyl-tRNA synthetase
MTPDEAIEAGALALFGEKYGDEVRVVSMGGPGGGPGGGVDAEHAGLAFSTELCGGTHVRRAGDIGFLKILGESALASGVRRIEAVTGAAALDHVNRQEAALAAAAAALKAAPAELAERVTALVEERKRLDRELGEARRKLAAGGGAGTGREAEVREVAGVKYSARVLADLPAKDLKPLADELKKQIGSGVVALISVTDGKASLVVGVTADLTAKFSAVDLVRAGSAALGGKGGGGRPDMAQAGGPDGAKADAALDAIESAIAG